MSLRRYGLKITGRPQQVKRSNKQLTLLDFGLTFEPHPDQTTLLDYQGADSHD